MQSNQQEGTLTKSKSIPATVAIHFTDGTTQRFEFEAPEIDLMTSTRLEKLLVRNELQIHLSDRVLVIPMQSIKCMEFTPAPDLPSKLREFVIHNARLISASQAMKWYDLEPPQRPTGILENGSVQKRPMAPVKK